VALCNARLKSQTLFAMLKDSSPKKKIKNAVYFPIFKKGDPKVKSNYRGIYFQNAIAKVFSALLLDRLKNWLKDYDILSEFQAGFGIGYLTVANIFSLISVASSYLYSVKKLYAFLVDFGATFESIEKVP